MTKAHFHVLFIIACVQTITKLWLVPSAKQRRDPCSGPPTVSTNYRKCVSNCPSTWLAGCCVDSSSVKQCLPSVNDEQLPNANDTELLALLAQQVAANHRRGRFSIETPLENADYNSSASGSKKTTAKKRKHRLAQRRQRRQLSDHKRVQRQRQNTSITL